jgi:hypothetical protein
MQRKPKDNDDNDDYTKCFTFPVTMGKNVPLYMFFKAFVNCTPPGVCRGETLEISPTMKGLQRQETGPAVKTADGFSTPNLSVCLPVKGYRKMMKKASQPCLPGCVCFLESTMAWWVPA